MKIFCLNCFSSYKVRRKKWWDVACPSCGKKPVCAFAYDRELTVVEIIIRLFKFHFGNNLPKRVIKNMEKEIEQGIETGNN